MMQEDKISARKSNRNKAAPVNVNVISFEEENIYFLYMPSLDLTGYGNTRKEAEKSLKVVLDEFIKYTIHKNTLLPELQRMGWKVTTGSSPLTPPKMSDMVKSNDQLKDIINTKNYSTSYYKFNIPTSQ